MVWAAAWLRVFSKPWRRNWPSASSTFEQYIDVLVNNADLVAGGAFDKLGAADWDRTMDINTRSRLFFAQAMLEPRTETEPWTAQLHYAPKAAAHTSGDDSHFSVSLSRRPSHPPATYSVLSTMEAAGEEIGLGSLAMTCHSPPACNVRISPQKLFFWPAGVWCPPIIQMVSAWTKVAPSECEWP